MAHWLPHTVCGSYATSQIPTAQIEIYFGHLKSTISATANQINRGAQTFQTMAQHKTVCHPKSSTSLVHEALKNEETHETSLPLCFLPYFFILLCSSVFCLFVEGARQQKVYCAALAERII